MRPFYLSPESRMPKNKVRSKFAIQDKNENIFQLGCFSQRATIASQQQRALNLAWALNENEMLENKKVAIVGAGFSGTMFAAALKVMTNQCDFHLFDKSGQILFLQRGNATRFIQPYIYDWPANTSRYPKTFFPYLNWDSGSAGEIVLEVERQWKRLAIVVEKREASLIHPGKSPVIEWKVDEFKTEKEEFDFVVLAVGFGIEVRCLEGLATSYWNNDSLNQSHLGKKTPATVFVSGSGDGALIDAIRAAVKDFNHATFTFELLDSDEKLYRDFVNEAKTAADQGLGWRTIKFPEQLLEKVKLLLRDDTIVKLNCDEDKWFSSKKSAYINRVIVAILANIGAIEFELGEHRTEKVNGEIKHFLDTKKEPLEFDHFVLRHGVKKECVSLIGHAQPAWDNTEKEWVFEHENPLLDMTSRSHYDDDFLLDKFMRFRGELEYEVVYSFQDQNDVAVKKAKVEKLKAEIQEIEIQFFNMREAVFLWPQNNVFYDSPCYLGPALRASSKSRKSFLAFLAGMEEHSYYSYGVKVSNEFFCEKRPHELPWVPIRFPGATMQLTIDERPKEISGDEVWWLRIIQRLPQYPLRDAHGLLSADDMLAIARYEWSLKKMSIVGWRMIESPKSNFEAISGY